MMFFFSSYVSEYGVTMQWQTGFVFRTILSFTYCYFLLVSYGLWPTKIGYVLYCIFLVFTWHGMPIHLCAHSIGPCSWTPTAARPWQEVVFLLLFQCISRVGVGWGMLTFLVSGTQRNWRVGLGWGGVGHVLTFMWTCGERKCFSVAAGRWIYARVGWAGVGHVLTFMWTCGGRTCFSVATVRSLEPSMHASCYATVSSLELSTHTYGIYVMPRYCKFSGTFHAYVMLRACKFSWTFDTCVMPR